VFVVFCLVVWFWPTANTPASAGGPAQNSSFNVRKERPPSAAKSDAKQELSVELKAEIAASARKLGTQEIRVDNPDTFFFRRGEYVTRPYTIRRDGYTLSMNGFIGTQLPAIPEDYETLRPKLPAYILKRDISWKEIDAKEPLSKTHWRNRQLRWFLTHYPPLEAKKLSVEFIRTLPFVKEAEWRNGFPKQYLHVVSHAGDARDFFTSWWNPERKAQDFLPTAWGFREEDRFRPFAPGRLQYFDEILDKRMKSIEKGVSSGDVNIIGTAGSLRIEHSSPRWKNIVNVVAILKSDASDKLKAHEIYPRIVDKFKRRENDFDRSRSNDWAIIKQLVRNFKAHPQLDERIAKLKKEHNIADWKQPPEPAQPKVPAKLKNDPRLTPVGTIRAALKVLEAKNFQEYIDHYLKPSTTGKQQTVKQLTRNDYPQRLTILLRHIQNDKPIIDDIDDTCYFAVDAEKFKGTVARGKFPLRKIGPLWLIGY